MINIDKESLQKIFCINGYPNNSIYKTDDIYDVLKDHPYKDMQPRHFAGIGSKSREKEELFRTLAKRFKDYFINNNVKTQEQFNEWHEEQCTFLNSGFEKMNSIWKDIMTRGKAQKLINITFKHLYFFKDADEDLFKFCHIPIDSFILNWANIREYGPWSKMDSEKYNAVQNIIRDRIKNEVKFENCSPFLAEFYIWEEAKLDSSEYSELKISSSDTDRWKLLLKDEHIRNRFKELWLEKDIKKLISDLSDIEAILNE